MSLYTNDSARDPNLAPWWVSVTLYKIRKFYGYHVNNEILTSNLNVLH